MKKAAYDGRQFIKEFAITSVFMCGATNWLGPADGYAAAAATIASTRNWSRVATATATATTAATTAASAWRWSGGLRLIFYTEISISANGNLIVDAG
ncbi:hypothetical protein D3C81_1322560 [compost metagenome]